MLRLLPQGAPQLTKLQPLYGREDCHFVSRVLQCRIICSSRSAGAAYGLRVVEVGCGGTLVQGVAQLDVDVDGCDHGEEVCVGDTFCHCCAGPALC